MLDWPLSVSISNSIGKDIYFNRGSWADCHHGNCCMDRCSLGAPGHRGTGATCRAMGRAGCGQVPGHRAAARAEQSMELSCHGCVAGNGWDLGIKEAGKHHLSSSSRENAGSALKSSARLQLGRGVDTGQRTTPTNIQSCTEWHTARIQNQTLSLHAELCCGFH